MNAVVTITERFIERERQRDEDVNETAMKPRSKNTGSCDWLPLVRKQLQAISSLHEGWDSYGASNPDARIVQAAQWLIECVAVVDLPQPHVNPTRNGGVQFEWEAGQRYFELEVVAERAATYIYCDDAVHTEETGNVFEEESLESVLKYIRSVDAVK